MSADRRSSWALLAALVLAIGCGGGASSGSGSSGSVTSGSTSSAASTSASSGTGTGSSTTGSTGGTSSTTGSTGGTSSTTGSTGSTTGATSGSTGSSEPLTAACGPVDAGPGDAALVCYGRCTSQPDAGDAYADVAQTSIGSGRFLAHVVQTTPTPVDLWFSDVTASWSGHAYNFDGRATDAGLLFHELARGVTTVDDTFENMEVYPDDGGFGGGPIEVHGLSCSWHLNP